MQSESESEDDKLPDIPNPDAGADGETWKEEATGGDGGSAVGGADVQTQRREVKQTKRLKVDWPKPKFPSAAAEEREAEREVERKKKREEKKRKKKDPEEQ